MSTGIDQFNQTLTKCCSIIRNNDKLSSDGVFDDLSKILFMKYQYDRKCQTAGKGFSPEEFNRFLNHAGEEIKREIKDDRLVREIKKIQVKQPTLEQIIEEIGKFNLPEMPDEIKGPAYQELMGNTLNKQLRQFFTPLPIVDFMVKILDPSQGEIICDPCCGSGSFLVRTLLHLKETFQPLQCQLHRNDNERVSIADMTNGCIFGVDANPRMAWASKLNIIMHGGRHDGIHFGDGLLNKRGIFDGRFDVVFANPPFGGRVIKELTISPIDCMTEEEIADYGARIGANSVEYLRLVKSNVGKPILELFDMGKITKLTEALFMERCLRLLKPGGRMGIILPEGVLNSDKFQEMRDYAEGKAKLILIASLPKEAFRHLQVGVTAGIVFLKKFTFEEAALYQRISIAAKEAVSKKFAAEIGKTGRPVKGRKQDNRRKKELAAKMEAEIRSIVKEEFDYEIPVVSIEKAAKVCSYGIDENQLRQIAEEYMTYRKKNKLWDFSGP
ncbi:MAG: N-6 DNA methylase [Candidatus Aminicenantes bacterium]|jgi:type I restriction enzyme M protein